MNQNHDNRKAPKEDELSKKEEFRIFKEHYLKVFQEQKLPQYQKNCSKMLLGSTIKANSHKKARRFIFRELEKDYFALRFNQEFLQQPRKELCDEINFLLDHTYKTSPLEDSQLERDFRDKLASLNKYANTMMRDGDVLAQKEFKDLIQTVLDEVYLLDNPVDNQRELEQ